MTGTVTLDGEPLAGVVVVFEPVGARPSTALTDDEGRYSLVYLRNTHGAVVGKHQVKIDRVPLTEGQTVEHLPPQYNRQTALTAEVQTGSNQIDFAIESAP